MRVLVLFIIINLGMFQQDFHYYLGKQIGELKDFNIQDVPDNENLFISENTSEVYFGSSFTHITVETNNQKYINNITLYFDKVLDQYFFDSLIKNYGEPNSILVENEVLSTEIEESDGQFFEERIYSLKEGQFDENPKYVLWNKDGYQLRILIEYRTNTTQLTFRNPTSEF